MIITPEKTNACVRPSTYFQLTVALIYFKLKNISIIPATESKCYFVYIKEYKTGRAMRLIHSFIINNVKFKQWPQKLLRFRQLLNNLPGANKWPGFKQIAWALEINLSNANIESLYFE